MLKRVKWNNFKALGNLELDFSKEDGGLYSTIILAGENGVGKTTILETLGKFLTGYSIAPFDYMDYDAAGKSIHIEPKPEGKEHGFHTRKIEGEVSTNSINTCHNYNPEIMKTDCNDIRSYGCVYSSAKSIFDTENIKTITSQQIDATQYAYDVDVDFTSIKQLLIDVETQDSNAFKKEAQNNKTTWEEFEPKSKMQRFKNAFDNFFDHIKYEGIDDSSGEQQVVFLKHEDKIPIDGLSTGEKQIVFRGAYLLRNVKKINGGIVLIDEPELSMHPKWQKKILSFYKKLFTYDGEQKAQLIIATHSEYVIREALKDKEDTLVIILEDDNGIIKQKRAEAPYLLPRLTAAEINFKAFNIYSIDYHIQLYGFLQEKTRRGSVLRMDNYIKNNSYYDAGLNKNAISQYGEQIEESLPTYIRNAIDHPDNLSRQYTDDELKKSTDILIHLIEELL